MRADEFFGDDASTEVVKGQRRIADRFAVAERVQRLRRRQQTKLATGKAMRSSWRWQLANFIS
jgi:hypothetical protein